MMIEFSIDRTDLMRALYPLMAGRARGKAAALGYAGLRRHVLTLAIRFPDTIRACP